MCSSRVFLSHCVFASGSPFSSAAQSTVEKVRSHRAGRPAAAAGSSHWGAAVSQVHKHPRIHTLIIQQRNLIWVLFTLSLSTDKRRWRSKQGFVKRLSSLFTFLFGATVRYKTSPLMTLLLTSSHNLPNFNIWIKTSPCMLWAGLSTKVNRAGFFKVSELKGMAVLYYIHIQSHQSAPSLGRLFSHIHTQSAPAFQTVLTFNQHNNDGWILLQTEQITSRI